MKLSLAVLAAAVGFSAAAPHADIKSGSTLGRNLLSSARRVEEANDNGEIDYTWVANMSLKFQGCYHTQTWNDEADGDEDVRISTQRLIRFRLCPSDSCATDNAGGCSSGYGDYIIDMETYLQAYFEAVQQDQEYNCEYEKNNDCACDGENQGDDFDEEICEYDCYMNKGMEYCVDRNPYEEEGQEQEKEEEWELDRMAECQEYKFENNNNNNRKLEEEAQYFLGAYCSENGGHIYMGLFTDDSCSQFADNYGGRETFAALSYGKSLPYSDTTMIGTECMSCKEPQDVDQNNQNDQEDADEVKESCEQLYQTAGKCEANLGIDNANNNACNFMQGIKITRKSGAVVRGASVTNSTASIFIGVFACSFVLLGGYAYYLKTKLDRAKINLSE
mmetsp:Transcript_18121/g.37795  ORF Transcript_18121/g.37795 Transcript_18121/m.37795 type:complete len:390 (-) Transcript_18121:248-1417(-)